MVGFSFYVQGFGGLRFVEGPEKGVWVTLSAGFFGF